MILIVIRKSNNTVCMVKINLILFKEEQCSHYIVGYSSTIREKYISKNYFNKQCQLCTWCKQTSVFKEQLLQDIYICYKCLLEHILIASNKQGIQSDYL